MDYHVKQTSDGRWGVYQGDELVKAFDARFDAWQHMVSIDEWDGEQAPPSECSPGLSLN